MKKLLLLFTLVVGCGFMIPARAVTDVFVSDMITNEAFQDISYLSPQSGVSYLSSLYTFEDEIVFQDDRNNMRTAIAGSSADGLVLESIEIGWHPNPLESNVGRTIVVYAKDEPYASSLDVYDSELRGVEIGRATYPETTLTVAPGHSNIVVMAELDRFGLVELNALSFNWKSQGITDVFVSEMITNEAFQDISYLSPQTGVSYLSSLYTFEDEIVFQDDRNNMRTAIAGSSADGLVLESIEIGWHPNPLESNEGRTIVVYAKDEPYASSLDVYDSELRGVEIGRATYPETTLTVAPGHSNIVVMAELDRFGLVELNALSFNWAGEMKQAIEPLSVTTNSGLAVADRSKLNIFEPTTITITTSTPGVEFEWSMGAKSGTSKDALSLEIAEDGILNVTATKEGYNSRTFECTFVYYAPVTSIQNYWNRYTLYDEGINDEFTVQFESTVVYAANVLGDGQVIITDGINFARVYFEGREVDFAPGDVIAAGWTSTLCRRNAWKDFTPQSELTVVSHDGVVPAPVAVADAAALELLDPGTPVVVRRATLDKATSADVYYLDDRSKQIIPKDANGQEILPMVNAFGLPSQPAGTYDIYGLVNFYAYKRTNAPAVGPTDGDYSHLRWRVAPTRYEQWLPTTPRPRFGHSDGAMLAAGTPIEISCQDAEATIMYSLDGGEYAEYSADSRPVMPDHDVTVTAYARKEGQHDSEARSISLRVDPNSGLTQIEADASDVRYYDLSGRACAQPLSAGVYIRLSGGRAEKVLVK